MFLLWLSCPDVGIRPLPQFPPATGRSSPTNTPVFLLVPSSCWVLCGSIYSFPLVRYSCPFSAAVLHACLWLQVYLFLTYPWREMYSTSTYSSVILFSPPHVRFLRVDIMQPQPSVSGWVSNQCPFFSLLGKLSDSCAPHCWRSMAMGLTCLFLSEIQQYCSDLFWSCVCLPASPCLHLCLANCLEGTEHCDSNCDSRNNKSNTDIMFSICQTLF